MYEIRETLLKIKGCTFKITLFLAAYCSLQQTWYQIDDWDVKQQTEKKKSLSKKNIVRLLTKFDDFF